MELKIEWIHNDRAVVHLEGPFDRETAPAVRKKLLGAARKRRVAELVLDCTGISSMDSAGVAVLIEVLRAVSHHGGTLRLRHLSEKNRKMIQLARLTELFEIETPHDSGLKR